MKKVPTTCIIEKQTELNNRKKKANMSDDIEWRDESWGDTTSFFRTSSSQIKQKLETRHFCDDFFFPKDIVKQSNQHMRRITAYKNKTGIFWDFFNPALKLLA